MGIKIVLLVLFFAVMVAVGVYSRKHATSVDGFVLGGRSVATVADCFRIWNILLLGSCICRLCRTVRMEIRTCKYMDRTWQCDYWKFAGMGCIGKTNQSYDAASECQDNAGFLRRKIRK